MIVRPALISASSAPDTSPLKSCETKFAQVSTASLAEPIATGGLARTAGCLARQVTAYVGLPSLQPKASGACIIASPGTISTTS